ncbi:hypothetical protein I317_06521 [Kwoniella heveanensis CBS 569]|nr:hypothetical protein I317_06521 [Kwoniella heveanensis CBS 569]
MGALGNVSGSNLIGVGIACGGNVLISLALTLQKLAHRRNEESVRQQFRSNSDEENDTEDGDANFAEDNGYQETSSSLNGDIAHSKPSSSHTSGRNHATFKIHGTTSPIPEEDTPTPSPSPRPLPRLEPSLTRDPSFSSSASAAADPYIAVDGSIQVDSWTNPGTEEIDANGATVKAVPVVIVPPTNEFVQPEAGDGNSQNRGLSPVRLDSPPRTSSRPSPSDNGDYNGCDNARNGDRKGKRQSNANDGGGEGEGEGEVHEGMYLKSKLWWAGMVLISIGEGGNFLSYGFAPASVVAPLGTVALIANCIFAPLILRERFHKRELIGMALAILGAVTVVWSSNGSNPRLDPSQLIAAIRRLPFVIYTILNVLLLIPLIFLSNSHWGHTYLFVDLGITCLFGGFTVLSTKALSSLLSSDFFGAWQEPITWFLVLVVAGTSVGQIRWLNRALMRFQSKEVIPTQFVLFSLSAIIGSAVLFQEFRDVPFSRFVNFAFGICTTFLGVHLLTSTSSESGSEDDSGDLASDDGESQVTAKGSISRSQLQPQRASSSASLNLLIPTSNSNERMPLLIPQNRNSRMPLPIHFDNVNPNRGQIEVRASNTSATTAYGAALSSPSSVTIASVTPTPTTMGRIKLSKRTSTGEFTPTLGLGSQAGLLLMATTPPNPQSSHLTTGRGRSASRTTIGNHTANAPAAATIAQRVEDEEAGAATDSSSRNAAGAKMDRTRSTSRSRGRETEASQ